MLTHKELKSRALERPEVKKEYDRLEREFACIDESFKARPEAGVMQVELFDNKG
jgi:hypothetical protein